MLGSYPAVVCRGFGAVLQYNYNNQPNTMPTTEGMGLSSPRSGDRGGATQGNPNHRSTSNTTGGGEVAKKKRLPEFT